MLEYILGNARPETDITAREICLAPRVEVSRQLQRLCIVFPPAIPRPERTEETG